MEETIGAIEDFLKKLRLLAVEVKLILVFTFVSFRHVHLGLKRSLLNPGECAGTLRSIPRMFNSPSP